MPDLTAIESAAKPRRGKRRAAGSAEKTLANEALLLPAELGVEQAAGLRAQLEARLADARSVVLDASEVQRIHTAAMQLFCLFCSDRRSAGHDTQWHRPSPALRSAAALLGVTTLLQIARENA